jgi:hypothetical protein
LKTLFDSGDIIKIFKELEADIRKLWCFAEKCCAKIPINIGTGFGLYKRLNRDNWEFKSILAGDNITITSQSDTITINSTGGGAVTCDDIDVCLGISPSGAANKYLNEQGDFVTVSGSGFTCSDLSACSTTNLPEGSNLYFTNARSRAAISAGVGISYDNITGVITNTAPSTTSGTVTSMSFTNNTTFTGVVTNSTTIPNLILTLVLVDGGNF